MINKESQDIVITNNAYSISSLVTANSREWWVLLHSTDDLMLKQHNDMYRKLPISSQYRHPYVQKISLSWTYALSYVQKMPKYWTRPVYVGRILSQYASRMYL